MNKKELKSYLGPYSDHIISTEYLCYGLDYFFDKPGSPLITFCFEKKDIAMFMIFLNDLLCLLRGGDLILVRMRPSLWESSGFVVQCDICKRNRI